MKIVEFYIGECLQLSNVVITAFKMKLLEYKTPENDLTLNNVKEC